MAKWNTPADLKYTSTDEWVRLDGSEAVIGVTDYAQDALSDIVYVELPSVGDSLKAGNSFGTVESVKAASDMHMPVGGTILAVNKALEDTPEKVNQDPYEEGWFIRIRPDSSDELSALMDAAAYEKYCEERH